MKEQNDKWTCFSVAASDQNMSYTMYKYLLWEKRASWVTFSPALSPFLLPEALLVPIPLPHSLRVSGSLACSVQAAVTKCHGPGDLNNRHLFFTVLEAGISKLKEQARKISLRSLLLACRWLPSCRVLTGLLLCVAHGERVNSLLSL